MFSRLVNKLVILITVLLMTAPSHGSEYSPPGLYDVESLTLDNGMDVILKPRTGAHTFSIRLWVGLGTQDYPCEQQETPHFLEHLLFTGTSKYTEAELDHLVADHGGSWNAYTSDEDTVYEMNIYSKHAEFAVNMLYEILTDSTITEKNVETSRDIIHRESGGKPSKIRQWFRLSGFGVSGTEKAVLQLLPGVDYVCEGFVTAEGITREEILHAYNTYYVPGNMALIVVGDFDTEMMVKHIKNTFGSIPTQTIPDRNLPKPDIVTSYEQTTGTFSPLLSDDAVIGIIYRLPGYWSDDHYPIMVLEEYLQFRLSEVIRIERGLAYAPGTWREAGSEYGLFSVYADVNLDDIDETMSLIKAELNKLVAEPMDKELLEKSKLKILLQIVQGYESNTDFADHYVSEYAIFRKNRYFENAEKKFEAVTKEDVFRVANEYFSEDKAIPIYETPTMTYTQFYILLSIIALIVATIVIRLYLRAHSHFISNK